MSVLGPFKLALILSMSRPHSHLMERALSLPDVRGGLVEPAVQAALAQETERVPAELLVSLAWSESRFRPDLPGRACGILQVVPADLNLPRSACRLWARDLRAAMAAGAREIEMDLDDPRVRGDMRRALMYRACGNSFFKGRCRKGGYVSSALGRARRLGWAP